MQKVNDAHEQALFEAFWYHQLTFDTGGEVCIDEGGSNTSKQVEAQRNLRWYP